MTDEFAFTVYLTGAQVARLTQLTDRLGVPVGDFLKESALSRPEFLAVTARKLTANQQLDEILELMDLGWSQGEISRRLGMKRETVANRVRIARERASREEAALAKQTKVSA